MGKAKTGWLLALLLVLLLAYGLLAPWLTVYQMKQAAARQDEAALAGYIDGPALRQGLKRQLEAGLIRKMASDEQASGDLVSAWSNALAGAIVDHRLPKTGTAADGLLGALGSSLADRIVGRMLAVYARPAGVVQLMAGEPLSTEPELSAAVPQGPLLADAAMAYAALDRFEVRMTDRNDRARTFVLQRHGLTGWQLVDILFD